jgi:hypothetical protein
MWTRVASGEWNLGDFTITDFVPLKQDNLRDTIDRIRQMDIDWPEDTLVELASFDEKSESIQ